MPRPLAGSYPPLLVNNWEATYFDFNEEKLLDIARTAAELGLELFVLDDGWFGKRNSDNCSLGDWTVNTEKLPVAWKALQKSCTAWGCGLVCGWSRR